MDAEQAHLTTTIPPTWLQQHQPGTLVIFRALQLGDMLCAVPALRALRTALPETRIVLVGLPWAAQFAARFPGYIDEFFAFPGHPAFPEQAVKESLVPVFYSSMRARHFDLALQMHGSGQVSNTIVQAFGARSVAGFGAAGAGAGENCFFPYPALGAEPLRLLQLTELLGAPPIGNHLEFPITLEDERELEASGVARGLAPGSYFCVHPGARTSDKCWPPERFAWVADQLAAEFGLTPVLTGAASETGFTAAVASHMRSACIDAAAPLSIGAMAALMSRARLLVCNDTGASHIAAGLKLSSVVIFSKADKRRWAPLDQRRHRCLWDPAGTRADEVLKQARELLAVGQH